MVCCVLYFFIDGHIRNKISFSVKAEGKKPLDEGKRWSSGSSVDLSWILRGNKNLQFQEIDHV